MQENLVSKGETKRMLMKATTGLFFGRFGRTSPHQNHPIRHLREGIVLPSIFRSNNGQILDVIVSYLSSL